MIENCGVTGRPEAVEKVPPREQVHELRNRLYASSLAFRAICRMLDENNPRAARAAAETMLGKLGEQIQDTAGRADTASECNGCENTLRVLIVEDDSMEARLLSNYLMEAGYSVTCAEDGIDALRQLKHDPLPDIVLLDMNMPRLSGPKMITSIRASDRLKHLTLIAISGCDATSPDMRKARRNVDHWITKPAAPERVIGAIMEHARKAFSTRISRVELNW